MTGGCDNRYRTATIITIDHAGRLVVPKRLRERFSLVAGSELEIDVAGDGPKLRKIGRKPSLVRKRGVLVHHGDVRSAIDVGQFIQAEREARVRRSTGELHPFLLGGHPRH